MNSSIFADAYYRLSIEDSDKDESSSIANQRSIVRQYCKDNNITLVQEFIDDGFSGSNFNRPGFQKLLKHIQSGNINMVITKDLSRLGRDMGEASQYAERTFPDMGIHYIAISDGFDSDNINLMAPFQFAMNDVYLRDTSRKIKVVLEQKRKNGDYCACPPFGYIKDPKNKNRITPDPRTAPIVQEIFKMAVAGDSSHKIASVLTDKGVITPLKYRVLYRDEFSERAASKATDRWCHTTVKRILKNQVYLGHTVLGKTKSTTIKSKKKIYIDEKDWDITKNTHTPLVTQEDYDKAQWYMGAHTKEWRKGEWNRKSIFSGIVYCENCGGAMCSCGTVKGEERFKYWYLSCLNIPQRSAHRCEHGARIKYQTLIDIVTKELNKIIAMDDEQIDQIVKSVISQKETQCSVFKTKPTDLKNRLSNIEKIIIKLYEDNASGLISHEQLSNMVKTLSNESNEIKEQLSNIDNLETELRSVENKYTKFFNLAKKYTHIDKLTPEIVRTFIERIDVGEKRLPPGYQIASHDIPYKQDIKITYRFIGKVENDVKIMRDAS